MPDHVSGPETPGFSPGSGFIYIYFMINSLYFQLHLSQCGWARSPSEGKERSSHGKKQWSHLSIQVAVHGQ